MQEIWHMVKNKPLNKIAIVGPESTGKSAMAQFLSKELKTIAVPEYARYYCAELNRSYTLQDEVNMFYGQIAVEDALTPFARNEILICDTTVLNVKIWCDHLFDHTPEYILKEIKHRPYKGYLLMDIDLPWEDDPLRDFPNERAHFMEVWEKELTLLKANYIKVSGLKEERFQNGLTALKNLLLARSQTDNK